MIRVGYEISFQSPQPAPMIVLLSIHPERLPTIRKSEQPRVTPLVRATEYIDRFGNRCSRRVAPQGRIAFSFQ
ncbi:hypothetical protein [Schlesneria sp. DSM 10557]|uniref:hypothetical protein n=1 Tax=Schlesneria sp. DSM 10557 TaxID=3044399 RepID=UPI0035C7E390